jgi:hypothetical protein
MPGSSSLGRPPNDAAEASCAVPGYNLISHADGTSLRSGARDPYITRRRSPVAQIRFQRSPPTWWAANRSWRPSAHSGAVLCRALSIVGEELIGKSSVVGAAFGPPHKAVGADDIVVRRQGPRRSEELLHEIRATFFDSHPPFYPLEQRIIEDRADDKALIVIDASRLEHGEANRLACLLPAARIVVAGRERRWRDKGELPIRGSTTGGSWSDSSN